MADVTLAEVNGQVWLVGGAEYLDDLLFNQLPDSVTIEIVPCATRSEVWAMWRSTPEGGADESTPWAINPAIVTRIRGSLGEQCIRFTAWSAMLTTDAQAVVQHAAGWLAGNASGRLALRQYQPGDLPLGLADLQHLRGQLVAGALARAGADAQRVDHETRPSEQADDAERMDVVTIPPSIAA